MPPPRLLSLLVATALLVAPAAALASSGPSLIARGQRAPSLTPGPPGTRHTHRHHSRARHRHAHHAARRGVHHRGARHRRHVARPASGLAKTGYDLRIVVLLGLGLLVCGIGLRLRTVEVRRF